MRSLFDLKRKKNRDKSIKADHPAKQPQHPAGIDSAGG